MNNREIKNILKRIDWILSRLNAGTPFNSHDFAAEFGVCRRTCRRYIRVVREYYNLEIRFDMREKTFYLRRNHV